MRVGGAVKSVSASGSVSRAAWFCLTDDEELDGQSDKAQPRQAGSMVEFMRLHDNLVGTASVVFAITVITCNWRRSSVVIFLRMQ